MFPALTPLIALLFVMQSHELKFYQDNISKKITISVVIITLSLPFFLATNYLSSILFFEFSEQDTVKAIKEQSSISIPQFISLLFLSPFLEELYFRGILFSFLNTLIGPFWAILIASMYFALIHINVLALPSLFTLGIILGLVYYFSQNLLFSIFVHIIFNAVMLSIIL